MSDKKLKPCPMCEAAWPSVQVRWIGFKHTHNGAFSAGYRGECCECGLITRAFNDEAEAIEAWNTRAERTCRNMNDKGYSNRLECSACGYGSIVTDCRERRDVKPRYCPNCGAKVVDS